MKHLKTLGLAALAVLGLMAFAGASTASATTLFKDNMKSQPYSAGTTFHATLEKGTSAKLMDAESKVLATCTESTIDGLTKNNTGKDITVNVEAGGVTWGGCNQFTATTAGGELDIEYNSNSKEGEVIGTGFGVTVNILGVTCTYGFGSEGKLLGTIVNGAPAKLPISTTVIKVAGSFVCPTPAAWTANYVITSPEPLFVGP